MKKYCAIHIVRRLLEHSSKTLLIIIHSIGKVIWQMRIQFVFRHFWIALIFIARAAEV